MTLLQLSPIVLERTAGGKPRHARPIQILRWLRRRGPIGVASWEIVDAGIRNQSQYVKDLVALGFDVRRVVEMPPNADASGWGTRLFLAEYAPAEATPIRPAGSRTRIEIPSAPPAPKTADGPAVERGLTSRPRRRNSPRHAPAAPSALTLPLFDLGEHETTTERRAA